MAKVIVESFLPSEVSEKGIDKWPVWTKEISRFDWTYNGDEECYITEGESTIETSKGIYQIKPGDFITFKDGLKCVWDIAKPVKKYYNFP